MRLLLAAVVLALAHRARRSEATLGVDTAALQTRQRWFPGAENGAAITTGYAGPPPAPPTTPDTTTTNEKKMRGGDARAERDTTRSRRAALRQTLRVQDTLCGGATSPKTARKGAATAGHIQGGRTRGPATQSAQATRSERASLTALPSATMQQQRRHSPSNKKAGQRE